MLHKKKRNWIAILLLGVFLLTGKYVSAATLSLSPATSNVNVGNIFTVNVLVNTQGDNINTSDAVIQFPSDLLQVVSVSKSSSIFSLWVEDPNFSNSAGQVSFNGGIPNPGYTGSLGQLISITFQAKKTGTASVIFSDSSVRANDGLGTDVLTSKSGATYSIVVAAPAPVAVPPPVKQTPKVEVPIQTVTTTPQVPVSTPVIYKKPEISIGEKYGQVAIVGKSSYGDSEVVLSFTSTEGVNVYITDITQSDGSFVLSVPNILKHQDYNVVAIIDNESSNKITVTAGSIISDISFIVWSTIAFLLIIIVGLIIYIIEHKNKKKVVQQVSKRDIKEAEDVLHKSFDILREDLTEYIHEKIHTATDKKNASILEKEIDDAENVISEKIKDIEK